MDARRDSSMVMTEEPRRGEAPTGRQSELAPLRDWYRSWSAKRSAKKFAKRSKPGYGDRRRALLRGLLIVLALLLGYYLLSLFQVWSTGRTDQARGVDAIVVMGAAQYDGRPSPQLAGRLDHVVELWPLGLASTVVVTGGKQPGDRFTEAETSAAYLIERGVPEAAIVLENVGRSTNESMRNVAALLSSDLGKTSVLIVTDPYHSLRSRLIAQDVGLTAYVSPTPYSVVTGTRSLRRNLLEAGGVAVGRIVGFGRL